jgi:DnaJ-class molecular chaperone
VKLDIEVNFIDAINGCDTEIIMNKRVICGKCGGRRADMQK